MAQRPYATDWVVISDDGVEYSAEIDRYWYQGRVYDERSAHHNGLIGPGARLREITRDANKETPDG